MPTPRDVVFFETPAELRAWFEANHDTATELWLGYHRKRTGRASVSWPEVVDQELCFGWIDSVRYSLTDDTSAQRLPPRRKGSIWSDINIRRFAELERQGLVHPSGRAAFVRRGEARARMYSYENRGLGLDPHLEAGFCPPSSAREIFQAPPPSHPGTAALFVMSAQREGTQ